jgi:hypothetical protein
MSLVPTGQLFGDDLVLTRAFRAPIADVWPAPVWDDYYPAMKDHFEAQR